jgi:hypothetical protein
MSDFGHEAKIRLQRLLVPLLIGLLGTVVAVFAFSLVEELRIDRCLDRGGSYDHESKECDFAISHPPPE